MSHYTMTCPECSSDVTLAARRLLVRVDEGTSTGGELVFRCLMCDATVALPVDAETVAVLVTGGVTFLALSERPAEHPESPGGGRPFTTDDLLDLHAELASDCWLERLGPVRRPED